MEAGRETKREQGKGTRIETHDEKEIMGDK